MIKASDTTLSYLTIISASTYLPLTFWASNAWDIGSPITVVLYGISVSVVGISVFLILRKTNSRELSLALSISVSLMVLMSWQQVPLGPFLAVMVIGVAITAVALIGRSMQRGIALGFILLFGVASLTQLIISHVREAAQIPLLTSTTREPATATDLVEDVLVVVVDSYPSLAWADQRFGHDTEFLETAFADAGFVTPAVGWSQHLNTSFSVSALMELRPTVDTTSKAPWSNSRNLASIIGGDSLVASTFRSAGFKHTHIESGWHHGRCSEAEVCIPSSWLNETTWSLLEPSIVGGWLEGNYGSWLVPASKSVEQNLGDLEPLFHNGEHDYVYAHLMLPHEPFVVDENCDPIQGQLNTEPHHEPAIRSQLRCTDLLLSRIIAITNEKTAVLITGDHGFKSNGQLQKHPDLWTESDIADAFSVLLSYKLPASCSVPDKNTNTIVMSAVVECATTLEAPPNDGELLIGLRNHRWIDDSTKRDVERLLNSRQIETRVEPLISDS